MADNKRKSGPSMEGPSTYRIRVVGQLYESWCNRLGGMKIVESRELGGRVETVLQGDLADQAALTGVLHALYDMHLPIISAEYLGDNPSPMNGFANSAP